MTAAANTLRARRVGIDTKEEAVAFVRADCSVCRSEGLAARARIRLDCGGRAVIATLYQVTGDIVAAGDIGLSEAAWTGLAPGEGGAVAVSHPPPLTSLAHVRGKIYGLPLGEGEVAAILADVVAGRYSDIQLSAFVAACAARPLDAAEIVATTRAMVAVGERLDWGRRPVADKHCVGGLPGNRTTPIVVAIAAACGLLIPKTSSRAITSPAGTADTMETLAPIDLDIPAIRRVVEAEGGCVVWGGAVRMSPADDILIRVERALDLDGEGQLVASVLSKKVAAGATHLVLDLPVGPTAKVRSGAAAAALERSLIETAAAFGLTTRTVVTDGTQPVGSGIGPALEARALLAVLRGEPGAPEDLRRRSTVLAGALLELAGTAAAGRGEALADDTLRSGAAWSKFQRICVAQGGMRTPPVAPHRLPTPATHAGRVAAMDNRRLALIAKLAGAPDAKAAGLELHVRVGDRVERGQPLFTIHAETPGELDYALSWSQVQAPAVVVAED